jgi:hypothetical protein
MMVSCHLGGGKLRKFGILAVATCLLWHPLASVAQDVVLAKPPLREELLPRSKVSTEIVMGVMLTGTGGDGKLPALAMTLPDRWVPKGDSETSICARVTSKNGRYTATNTYRIRPAAKAGRQPLDFNSKKLDFLRENEAAVRITLGDCQSRPKQFAPALWTGDVSGGSLHVFLNAGGQQAAVAADGPGDFSAYCADESEDTGLKYTARCDIPLEKLNPHGPTTLFFTVNRNRTAEHFQIDVVLPEN